MAMGLPTGGFAIGVIDRLLVAVGSDHVKDHFKLWNGMKRELKVLNVLLPRIQSLVEYAERREHNISDPLWKWLRQLKDVLHEADVVLNELGYFQLEQQADADANKSKAMKHMRKAMEIAKRILKPDPTLKKLIMVTKKLGEFAADARESFELLQRESQQEEARAIRERETGPSLTVRKVFGREKESDELLRWLTGREDGSNTKVSLSSVVGHGGMGKTTLAQLVFNDEIVQKSFDLKIWVYVSPSFDVRELTRSILTSIPGSAKTQRPDWGLQQKGLAELQVELSKKLESSGKFLLILDDVWNDDDSSNWDKLLAPLRCGHKGSKILLTTRMDQVAYMAAWAMGEPTKGSLKLDGLRDGDFSSLFKYYAFAGVDCEKYPYLQRIGMQIAERLGSSPLAARKVGGLLNSNLNDRRWEYILNSENISDLL